MSNIRPNQDNLDEFVQLPAGLIPANLNPRFWIVRQTDILGGFHQYTTLPDFLNLHPNKMEVGMEAIVVQHLTTENTAFPTTTFTLTEIPDIADWPLSSDPADVNFYKKYWRTTQEFEFVTVDTVYQYAADDENGNRPPYPYTSFPDAEDLWENEYDPAKNHKWLRYRNTDRSTVVSSRTIFLDWTIPLAIAGDFVEGDFVENRYRRAATIPTLPASTLADGTKNNEPAGWEDEPPTDTSAGLLWEIRAQKNVRGQLKSNWIGPFLVPEDEDLVRWGQSDTPDPNTIVNQTTSAEANSQADLDLIGAGWVAEYTTDALYKAQRALISANNYTPWEVIKVAGESGEYIERIYKLFPINFDFDNPTSAWQLENTPVGNDPVANTQGLARNEGWAYTPLLEDVTHINFYSEARKFFDGSLKTRWSNPKPWTPQDVFIDSIFATDNAFKFANKEDREAGINSDPEDIELTFLLKKGQEEITANLTYKWYIVYDNRDVIEVNPAVDVPLFETKTITVEPDDVNGKTIFRCYAYLDDADFDEPIEFVEEFSIVDITDGDDAKSLQVTTDSPIILYDDTPSEEGFSVDTIFIRAQQSFLTDIPFYWFQEVGGNWVEIENEDEELNNRLWSVTKQAISIKTNGIFAENTTRQEKRFICSTDQADPENDDAFFDIVTIAKLAALGTGAPGEGYTIRLSDEVDVVILNTATTLPIAGEITNSGTAGTLIQVYKNGVRQTRGTDFTLGTITSDTANVTFNTENASNAFDYKLFIATWTNNTARRVKATVPINIVGVDEPIITQWIVTTNLDDAGAIIGDLAIASDSVNKTFNFTPANRQAIKLESRLYQNGTNIASSNFTANTNWYVDGVLNNTGRGGTNGSTKTINRSDVLSSASIYAVISFGGTTFTTTPLTINDLKDSRIYRLFHHFNAEPNEPITPPTKPSNFNVTATQDSRTVFEATYPNTGTATGWYRQPQANTFFATEATETGSGTTVTYVWGDVVRIRGERGVQGPSADFIVEMFKLHTSATTPPTVPASNATRQQMLNNGWAFTPQGAGGSGSFLYKAVANFDGDKLSNLNANSDSPWFISRITPVDGTNGTNGATGPQGPAGDGIKTFYTGSSGSDTNTWKRIASVSTIEGVANLRRHLQLSIGARLSRGQGVLAFNTDTSLSGLSGLTARYIQTSPVVSGNSVEFYYRLINDNIEIWQRTLNSFTDSWFSVLHNYVSGGAEWIFYENNNSLTTVQPTGLTEIERISLADIPLNTSAITNINTNVTNINTEINTLKLINERPKGINTIRVNFTSGSSAQINIGYGNITESGTFVSGTYSFTVDPFNSNSFVVSGSPQATPFIMRSSGVFVCNQTGAGMNQGDIYSVTAVGGTTSSPTFTLQRVYSPPIPTIITELTSNTTTSTVSSFTVTRMFYRLGKMVNAKIVYSGSLNTSLRTYSNVIPVSYRPTSFYQFSIPSADGGTPIGYIAFFPSGAIEVRGFGTSSTPNPLIINYTYWIE
jgi:hypothetical protein